MTLDGDLKIRIMYDIAAGRSPEASRVVYSAEALAWRAGVQRRWDAWKAIHPDAELHIPAELPPTDI